MFMSILKRDDLGLKEIDVWNCIIKWGIGQSEEKIFQIGIKMILLISKIY